jgi:23S rRNA pseudouridine1911/1915/1917 synthase
MIDTHRKELIVGAEEAGERLDLWLASRLTTLSRTRIQRLIASGLITLDRRPAKPSALLEVGERVQVMLPPETPSRLPAETIALDIIYEDEDLVVVNKPSGLVVYPGAGHEGGTLINGLLRGRTLAQVGAPVRPGIVHRLDKETSGVIVVAKTDMAYYHLIEQFKRREVSKHYLALVHGTFAEDEGCIEAPIGRDPQQRKRMKVLASGGKVAITEFTVRKRWPAGTLLEAHPLTGRTHQIRVHFSAIGHPILGDRLYGASRDSSERLMLHAWQLELWHPRSGQRMHWIAPAPAEFETLLDRPARRARTSEVHSNL